MSQDASRASCHCTNFKLSEKIKAQPTICRLQRAVMMRVDEAAVCVSVLSIYTCVTALVEVAAAIHHVWICQDVCVLCVFVPSSVHALVCAFAADA